NILLDPYMKILKMNKDIKKSTKDQEDINLLLDKVIDKQDKIKEKLIYKEDFLKSILSSTPNGWVAFDKNLNLLYSNESFQRIINHSEGDIYNSMKKNIINYDRFISNISIAQRENLKIEDSIKTIDNKIYKCVSFNDKTNTESICLMFDITKEAYRLNSLINLKEEYEDLIKNIKTPVFICDNYNNIVAFSKSYEKVFDRYKLHINNNKKLDGEKFLDHIYSKDKDIARKVFKINQKAKSNEELYNKGLFRFRLLKECGEVIWLESKTTIYYEQDIKYKILSYRDITKYINSKKYLEKTQEIYKGVLDSIPEGIYLEDIESGEYIFINEKFKEIFKVKQRLENENLSIYRNDIMRIHPNDKCALYNGIKSVKDDKVSDYEDIRYIDNDGNIIEAKAASIPFKLSDKVFKLSIIKTMEDMKKLEELKNKIIEREKHDRKKMEFFINMSHELKTPLNLIFTSIQLIEKLYMKNNIYGDSIKNHIKLTKQNSYRLLKIINNLIDFTKMEAGFYNINMQNKDIISIVEDIVMSVVEYADNKGVQIVFDTNVEELIMGIDVNALEIIILNILSNAIKFTDSGGRIYVDLIYKEDIEKIDIIIRDTGIGIPKDKMNLIFKRFNDVNKGFVGNINGSGIGLSMVKSMSNLIGSKINVESEYGKGSMFTITLDIKEVEEYDYNDTNSSVENETLNVERLIVGMEDIYR
ncbi:HAMP domain-containing sensor histidine kinase, partial [Romboutsia sp.]|uniref:sensor histidine kinase n=1 Tax=Romboutsia sp. TaxID=1965302 RepID=UPI002BE80945